MQVSTIKTIGGWVLKIAIGLMAFGFIYEQAKKSGREVAPPVPDAIIATTGDDVAHGADLMFPDNRRRAAEIAEEVAAMADSFDDWQPAMDAWKAKNDAARLESQKLCVSPLDAFLKRDEKKYGKWDAKRFREGLEHVAKGLKGGGK